MVSGKKKLRYYDGTHTYYVGRQKLKSVTTLIGEHFPKFDANGLAKKIAKGFKFRNRQKELKGIEVTPLEKKKATQKYWKNEWKGSTIHGTAVHEALEQYLLGQLTINLTPITEERTIEKYKRGVDYLTEFFKKGEVVSIHPEKKIYSEDLGIAGTIDLMVIHKNNEVTLIDWKSNKSIDRKSKYNEFGVSEITKDVEACSFNKYSMQLLLYAIMLERDDPKLKVTKLCIVHLKEDKYEEINVKIDNYLKEKVLLIVEANKNDIRKN